MRAPSSQWFEDIARVRYDSDKAIRNIPLFPWLAPPLVRSVRDVIERWGVVRVIPCSAAKAIGSTSSCWCKAVENLTYWDAASYLLGQRVS